MPVFIEELEYTLENTVASTVEPDYLKGNVLQEVNCYIKFRVETWINCTTNDPITFQDQRYRTQDWITDRSLYNRFENFDVGDTIKVSGSSTSNDASYLISEKLDDGTIRVTDTGGASVTLNSGQDSTAVITLVQDPLSISYDFALIENKEAINFKSKVTNGLARYQYDERSASFLPTTTTSMRPQDKDDWVTGVATFKNLTTLGDRDSNRYYYEINHTFRIHPYYLPNQIRELNPPSGTVIPPKYFKGENCLKHAFRIRMYREPQEPDVYQQVEFAENEGQTGWFDEEYNGRDPLFNAQNFGYSGTTIQALDLRKLTTINFEIHTDTTITTGVPEWVTLCFVGMPEKDSDIQGNNVFMEYNYPFDFCQVQQAVAPGVWTPGNNNGGTWQVIKQMRVGAGTNMVTCEAEIEFGTDAAAAMNKYSNGGYYLAAYVSFGGQNSDLVRYTTCLLDVNNLDTDIDSGIIDVTNEFLYHDQNDNTTVVTTPKVKVEDEITVESLILLDQTPTTGYPNAQIEKFIPQIVAVKSGEDDVVLLEQEFDLSGNKTSGTVRVLNETVPTGYFSNSSEIRHNFRAYRSPSDDVGTEYAYRVVFPFLYRWEYWELLALGALPSGWYDTSEPFDGINNDWIRLAALSGWSLSYRLATLVTFNGKTKWIYSYETIDELDYEDNVDWDNEEIESFDGASQVDYAGDPFIIENKNTTIKANIDYIGGDSIDETDVYMVARLIPKEGGTFIANESLSSVWDREDGGIFIGDSNGKIVITESAGTFTGEFDIDYTELYSGVTEYTLSVSINRNSSASMTDFGYVWKQDVKVLEIIDFNPPVIPKEENPFKKCCYPLKALADLTDTDTFKNDIGTPMMIFPLQYTITMKLEKYNETTETWSTVATLTNEKAGIEKNNRNYYAASFEWRTYLSSDGVGKYRVAFDAGGGNVLYSEEYCLNHFSTYAADETVRITYKWNSVIGEERQARTRDFAGVDWTKQIRLNDAILWNKNGDLEVEQVKYQNGFQRTVKKGYKEKYTLEFRKLPEEILNLIVYDIIAADEITISDYNSKNFGTYNEQQVEVDGGITPNYGGQRPEVSLEINLKDRFDQRNKYYS